MRGSTYRGDRRGSAAAVLANGKPLVLPAHLRPTGSYGYDWGRINEHAGRLALALLYDATQDTRTAKRWELLYAGDVVAQLHQDVWELTTSDVLRWLVRQYEAAERGRA